MCANTRGGVLAIHHWYRFHWFSIRSGSRKVKIGTIYMCGGSYLQKIPVPVAIWQTVVMCANIRRTDPDPQHW
jgi:hypothetical protein